MQFDTDTIFTMLAGVLIPVGLILARQLWIRLEMADITSDM